MSSSGSGNDLVKFVESALGVSLGSSVTDTVIVIATTSFAVVIGLLVLVWKKSSDRSKEVKPVVPLKSPVLKEDDDEADIVSGKTKVTIFYGTQTGTAEGFAKVTLSSSFVCFV